MQRRGNRQGRQRTRKLVSVGPLTQQATLQDGLSQLLDEQWHTVGASDDLIQHLEWKDFAVGDAGNQRLSLGAVESAECHTRDMTIIGPGRREFWSRCSQQQKPQLVSVFDNSRE